MSNSTIINKQKWTIGKKLKWSFGVMAGITLLLGLLGYVAGNESRKSINELGKVRLPAVESLQDVNLGMLNIYASQEALQNPDLSLAQRKTLIEGLQKYWDKIDRNWSTYEPLPRSEQGDAIWQEFKPAYGDWKKDHARFEGFITQYIQSAEAGQANDSYLDQARQQFLNQNVLSKQKSFELLDELVVVNSEFASKVVEEAITESLAARVSSIIGLFLGVGLAAGLGFFITRSISNSLRNIIHRLSSGSEQVGSASEQLSGTSQQLAESSTQQAGSLQETSSSLEEVSSQIKTTADNSSEAEQAMKAAKPMVEDGVKAMKRMNQTMSEINESSQETSKIIKTIDDIAFQTNLLALNAAVEAARAGEAGKGFAVVAEEVRNLAQRSAEAARDTSDLIARSQESSGRGTEVAEEVSHNLLKIEESINDVNTLIVEISGASSEQTVAMQQISSVMSEMDESVQSNAMASEESASASEELSSQAAELNNVVKELLQMVEGVDHLGELNNTAYAKKPALSGMLNISSLKFGRKNTSYHGTQISRDTNGHSQSMNDRFSNSTDEVIFEDDMAVY